MHVRAVRFSDVSPEQMDQMLARINSEGGPPEGIPIKGLTVLSDADSQTALVLQHFDSAEDMAQSAEVFASMDPSETPGTRVSVDMTEQVLDMRV